MKNAATPAAPPLTVHEQLKFAMNGVSLQAAAASATSRARAGMAVGRVGSFRASSAEAAIDYSVDRIEDLLTDAKRRLADAESAIVIVPRDAANERAEVAAIEARLRVIERLGIPLAKRFALIEQLAMARAEVAEREAEHAQALSEKVALGPASAHVVGAFARKRAIDDREYVVRGKLERAQNAEIAASYSLRKWAETYPEIASALEAERRA